MENFEIFQETPEPEEKNLIEKDKTFNHLKKIQSLLKKESSLKEICKSRI